MYSRIIGTGSYLPEKIMTNDDLARIVDTSDEWIRTRSGIRSRHVAAEGQLASDLALPAAQRAMQAAGVTGSQIDLIIVATTTPDIIFPSTACILQAKLGIAGCPAFDVQAVCSGFVYGLTIADLFIRSGQAKHVLLVGTEVYSRILDWTDRATCVLFGDGAGAVLLRAEEGSNRGILSTHLHADGTQAGILYVEGTTGPLRMAGKEVFRQAVNKLSSAVDEALQANELGKADVNWLVPHQANIRIIDAMGRKLGLSPDRVVKTVDRHANTSAASVPLALAEAVCDGRIRRGDLVLLEAIGGGLTWGAALVRF